jgi:hypothetical protein
MDNVDSNLDWRWNMFFHGIFFILTQQRLFNYKMKNNDKFINNQVIFADLFRLVRYNI